MPHKLTEFDGVELPQYNPVQDDNTAIVPSSLVDSIGSTFDYYGTTTRVATRYGISGSGWYIGELSYIVDEDGDYIVDEDGDYIIAGTPCNMLRAQVQALRSKVGIRGTLTRQRIDDGVEQWITARLLSVNHTEDIEDAISTAEVDYLFESSYAAWRADTITTASGAAVDSVPKGITLSNGGDITIYDPVITVLVTSGTMTQLDIDGIDDAIDITWTGSISVGTTLQIDCAPQTVTNLSGTDQYSGFVLNSGHTVRGWLPINPGITPLLFTVTGAGANISVTHYDQFR